MRGDAEGAVVVLSLYLCAAQTAAFAADCADTVVYGTIRTAEEKDYENGAIAIKDGRYVYVGDEAGVAAYVEDGVTKVVSTWFEGEKVYQAGSEKNPWKVGTEDHEAEVIAWTNGTGTLLIEGAGAVGSMPWAESADGIAELLKDKGVTGLDGIMATLPSLATVNGLTLDELASAGMVGAAKVGFSTIAVAGGVAQLGVVVSTNSEVKVRGEGEDGGWGKAAIEKAEVVDGEAILTIPAPADKGFMILKTKGER